jgi:hypothetical protein
MLIAKYDASGTELWAKSAGDTVYAEGYGVSTDAGGNAYVTGIFEVPSITFGTTTLTNAGSFGHDMFITKYDASGTVLWAKSAGGSDNDVGIGVSTDAGGNLYVAGYFYSPSITLGTTTMANAGNYDVFIAKLERGTVGVDEIENEKGALIFPNPFSDQLIFSFADNVPTTISLYNFLGQEVLQHTFTNSTTINTEQLADGIYFYELRKDKGALKTGKLVKQ